MISWLARKYCAWFGHNKVHSPLKRSSYTAHTHTRDIACSRCKADLGWSQEFYDSRKNPELF